VDKSAASFCRTVAACVTDLVCYFYSMKDREIADNSTTIEAGENQAQICNH
jgi:hypothetical protein